jgi:hypothetical protein
VAPEGCPPRELPSRCRECGLLRLTHGCGILGYSSPRPLQPPSPHPHCRVMGYSSPRLLQPPSPRQRSVLTTHRGVMGYSGPRLRDATAHGSSRGSTTSSASHHGKGLASLVQPELALVRPPSPHSQLRDHWLLWSTGAAAPRTPPVQRLAFPPWPGSAATLVHGRLSLLRDPRNASPYSCPRLNATCAQARRIVCEALVQDVRWGVRETSPRNLVCATLSGVANACTQISLFGFGMCFVNTHLDVGIVVDREFRPGAVGLGLLSGDPTGLSPDSLL